jgi:hypothetical protein
LLAETLRLVLTWIAYAAVLVAVLYVVGWPVRWLIGRQRGAGAPVRGWRPWAAWLILAVLVVAAARPLAADVQRRARIAKGRGDVLLLGKAVEAYAAHCGGPPAVGAAGGDCRVAAAGERGGLPPALLKAQRNARGAEAGPFVDFVRRLPPGWRGISGAYAYVVADDGRARVCAAGDGVVADSRGRRACP